MLVMVATDGLADHNIPIVMILSRVRRHLEPTTVLFQAHGTKVGDSALSGIIRLCKSIHNLLRNGNKG